MSTLAEKRYASFSEFYPEYLSQHSNRTSREMHFAGSTLALLCLAALLLTGNLWWLLGAAVTGFGLSWLGHFLYEKNRPSSFRHPLYSFIANWVLYWQMLTGQTSF